MNTILSLLLVISMGIIQNKLPFAGIGKLTSAAQGTVVFVGKETVNVDVGATVLRNVGVALPLTVEQIHNRDIVALVWNKDVPFVTNVLGHETALRYDPLEDTEPPPAPINVRVVQGGFGVRLEWDWGGTNQEKRDLSYYEVDARLPGGDWGYNNYPVSEGTREVHYSDAGFAVQCRVRAVDFRGNESAWVVSSELLADSVAPTAPWGFEVTSTTTGIRAAWQGPTTDSVPDLAGYYLYFTADDAASGTGWAGTGGASRVATISANTLSITHPMAAGEDGYFNLTAFDTSGNESGFASNPWVAGGQVFLSDQILTNSDFERGIVGPPSTIVDWYISEWDYLENEIYLYDEAGYNGSMGVYVSLYSMPTVGYVLWPGSLATQIPGSEGGVYTISFYVKVFPQFNLKYGDTPQSVLDTLELGSHNGTNWLFSACVTLDSGYVSLGDNWYRIWKTYEWHSAYSGFDYLIGGIRATVHYGDPTSMFYLDRAMLNLGSELLPWALNPSISGDAGLSLDTAGIIGDRIFINSGGEIESKLEPAADDTYDLGASDARWKGIFLSGDIVTSGLVDGVDVDLHHARHENSGSDEIDGDKLDIDWNPTNYTPSTAPAEADSVDHLTAHLYGIDQALGSSGGGTDDIDSYIDDADGVGIGTTWTTVCSQSITVPTGYRAFLSGMACVYADGTAVAQTIHFRIYDGTTSWQQYDRLSGTGGAVQAGLSCLTLKTGTYTVYLDIMKGTSDNTIYCTDDRAYLTVLIFPEKT